MSLDDLIRRKAKRERGLYEKFRVERVDGSDRPTGVRGGPPGKHFGCEYLVLDLTHDEHARASALAYAKSAEADGYGALAADIRQRVADLTGEVSWRLKDEDSD